MTFSKVLVAPDKFKGSLSASRAAAAIALGVAEVCPQADVVTIPIADGGEGTLDAAVAAGYEDHRVAVTGPHGGKVEARLAVQGCRAVIEMAEASGLHLMSGRPLAPLTATSYGTGELITAALDLGAHHILLGIGGSATNDGGAGMAQALGIQLLDDHDQPIGPGGAALAGLVHIDFSRMDARLETATVTVASDVDNPLIGPNGASAVYGPQKGATPGDVAILDQALAHYAQVLVGEIGLDLAHTPGAGAAGGVGAGAMAFLKSRLVPGISAMLDIVDFERHLKGADLVITGEGSLDSQTLNGKAPAGVATAAKAEGVPVVALCGQLRLEPRDLESLGIVLARSIADAAPNPTDAMQRAAVHLTRLASQCLRELSSTTADR